MVHHELENVVHRFNDCINTQNVEGLAALMTEAHVFIDSAGAIVRGKEQVLDAWRGFFEAFPDYENVFERLQSDGEVVTIVGRSTCSAAPLDGPALWTARLENGKLAEWRVYEDLPEVRHRLNVRA